MFKRNLAYALVFLGGLALLWVCAWLLVRQDRDARIHDAEIAAVYQAQASAENALSIIKRLDAVLLEMRTVWALEPRNFDAISKRRQADLLDLAFQIGVIGADGYLVTSNLAARDERVWLGDREHFRAHFASGDRLFISEPVKGKVSGKWSIQFSRPIFDSRGVAAVIVISVSPDTFAAYGKRLAMVGDDVIAVTNTRGVILARSGGDMAYGRQLSGTPFQGPNAVSSGYYRRRSQTDGVERIYGFHSLEAEGLVVVVGRSVSGVLAEHPEKAAGIITVTAVLSVGLGVILLMMNRLRATRARLRAGQAQFAAIVNGASDAIIARDIEGRVTLWNPAAERLFGFEAQECLGQQARAIVPQDIRGNEARLLQQVAQGAPVTGHETRRRTRDGRELRVASSLFAVRGVDGRVEGTAEIMRDITELKHNRRALAVSRALLKTLMASSYGFYWSVDADDLGLLTWNEGFAQHVRLVCGVAPDLGMKPEQIMPRGEVADYRAMYRRALIHGSFAVDYRSPLTDAVLSLHFDPLRHGDVVLGVSVFGEPLGGPTAHGTPPAPAA